MTRMPFSDYIELLYRAYLEDEGIIQRLRSEITKSEFIKKLDSDPAVQDWQQINPRSIDPRKHQKSTYYPNPINPQEGVRVFENQSKSVKRIVEAAKRASKR